MFKESECFGLPLPFGFAAAYSTSTTVNSTPTAPVNFDTPVYDDFRCVSSSEPGNGVWFYTVRDSGYYLVLGTIVMAADSTDAIYVYKNGVQYGQFGGSANSANGVGSFIGLVKAGRGDRLDVRMGSGSTNVTSGSQIYIVRVAGA